MQGNVSQDPSNSSVHTTDSIGVQGAERNSSAASSHATSKSRAPRKSNQICRFYGTKKGCRAQNQCPYRHVAPPELTGVSSEILAQPSEPSPIAEQNVTQSSSGSHDTSHGAAQGGRLTTPKPVSSSQKNNPREFQISQVVRRWSPIREDDPSRTTLRLRLPPSDPDFPFELTDLSILMSIPLAYPANGAPTIKVQNQDIPLGFQINVERGFDSLVSQFPSKSLLQLLNDLDRNLEHFLTSEKAQTVKIVANRKKAEVSAPEPKNIPKPDLVLTPATASVPVTPPTVEWTPQQRADAEARRKSEIRQLEARMGRVPLFASARDGVTFNIPIQIPKQSKLPLSLQHLKELTLIVPTLYNLKPCRIRLKGVDGEEAENVEIAFEKHAREHQEVSLMSQINYLTQNIHTLAISPASNTGFGDPEALTQAESIGVSSNEVAQAPDEVTDFVVDEDRPHIRFISQPPPEWSQRNISDSGSNSESSDDYDSQDDESEISDDNESHHGGASIPISSSGSSLEKGVLLSFPQLELHGIELLQVCTLSLVVRCDRCKDTLDVKSIKSAEPASNLIRTEACNKCANPLSISYRSEPMHANSIKAGYLDLESCTVVDMLPSQFLPTCSECSTVQPLPGITSVRGDSPMAVCRECHHRLNFKIPEVKFLRVSSNDPRLNLPLRSRRKKENLGISAGSELPDRGRCKHYTKSYRWFRFSCCNRVYPCDRCHDEKEEHSNEHANRMICGWCSREQNYRPEDCHACGRSVIRRTGGGFWEGGKGTRDKTKMSRKDPRKFKRIGGSAK